MVGSLFGPRCPSLGLISESGLYKLVMRSDKPEAREFQDWVTRVVLPAIRKDCLSCPQGVPIAARNSPDRVPPSHLAETPGGLLVPTHQSRIAPNIFNVCVGRRER